MLFPRPALSTARRFIADQQRVATAGQLFRRQNSSFNKGLSMATFGAGTITLARSVF